MKLTIRRDENEVITAITKYLTECDADELARIYEETQGTACSFVNGMYAAEMCVSVMVRTFTPTIREITWADADVDGYVVIGFIPSMEPEKGDIYAIRASIPKKGPVAYTEYGQYEKDMSEVLDYLCIDVCLKNENEVYHAFIRALDADTMVETYLRQNSPAVTQFLKYMRDNDGNFMCLNEGNDRFMLYIWDEVSKSVNDDGSNCTDGGHIHYTTDIEREVLTRFETSGNVVKIYEGEYEMLG